MTVTATSARLAVEPKFAPFRAPPSPTNIDLVEKTSTSAAEMRAAWEAAHPKLTPQQALASGAELGPAYDGNSRADNHVSKIHTEIKVNGKVIARVYNGGRLRSPTNTASSATRSTLAPTARSARTWRKAAPGVSRACWSATACCPEKSSSRRP